MNYDFSKFTQYQYPDFLGVTDKRITDIGCALCCVSALIYKVSGKKITPDIMNYLFIQHEIYVNGDGVANKSDSYQIAWYRIKKLFPFLEPKAYFWNGKHDIKHVEVNSIISVDVTKKTKRYDSHFVLVNGMYERTIREVFDPLVSGTGVRQFKYWQKDGESQKDSVYSIVNLI